jgi:hypothetical protein
MIKFLIPLAAAVSTVALAAPASAQWHPQPQRQGYAYGYGHNNNRGYARAMQARLDNIQRQIAFLAQRRMISRNEYNYRIRDSRDIEARLRRNARDGRGLSRQEAYETERRIVWLEQKIARDVRDGRHWGYRW